jgi:hypothetical protein
MLFTLFVTVVIGYIILASLSGCTSRKTTVETTRKIETSDSDRARYRADTDDGRVVERSETTTVERDNSSNPGLFSILGDIIALPFRAAGAVLSAIF